MPRGGAKYGLFIRIFRLTFWIFEDGWDRDVMLVDRHGQDDGK